MSLSKRKYVDLKERLDVYLDPDTLDRVLGDLREILKYDPGESTYDAEKGRKFMEWRKKRASELGMTVTEYRKGLQKST